MNVYQLSVAYVAEQDRILVRVNTREGSELQFWFTRRLTLGLSPLMDKVMADLGARQSGVAAQQFASMDALAKKAVTEFQRGNSLQNADFATPYKAAEPAVQLFSDPLLVTEVNIAPLANGQLRLSFSEKLPAGPVPRSFQLALSEQLVHAFNHLLERALQQSAWRRPPGALESAAAVPDGTAAPENSGYLN